MSYQLKKIDLRKAKKLQCPWCGLFITHRKIESERHISKCKKESEDLLKYLDRIDKLKSKGEKE